jgi:hypothetical protein
MLNVVIASDIMLNVIMGGAIMMNVSMARVVMLNVVAPFTALFLICPRAIKSDADHPSM